MPVFNLKNLNPGSWFDYDGGRVCIRCVAQADMNKIRKECTTKRTEYKQVSRGNHQRYGYVEADEDKIREMLYDATIVDWEGFLDEETGEEIPCNRENKIMLVGNVPDFQEWVDEKAIIVKEDQEKRDEELEKN